MTLRLVDKEPTTTGPTDSGPPVSYKNYTVVYRGTDEALAFKGEGYALALNGLFSLVKLDDKMNSYTVFLTTIDRIISVTLDT